MGKTVVKVPARLLVDRRLTASAKVLWTVYQLGGQENQVSPELLQAQSGLSRPTVLKGLAQLAMAGWLTLTTLSGDQGSAAPPPSHDQAPSLTTAPPCPTHRKARLPLDLLLDQQLSNQAKVLYGILQLSPRSFTYAQLITLTGLTDKTVHQAVRQLEAHGWVQLTQQNKFSPVHYSLLDPISPLRESDISLAKRRLAFQHDKGEAIMREFLSLIVESTNFEDNATPGWLINPDTNEELQLDRFYPPSVAFEFNGPQHYGTTALYSDEAKVRRQQVRDLIKTGICTRRDITLVIIHATDLSLDAMKLKIPSRLPQRRLQGHERLITYLEAVAAGYRTKSEGPN